jgi:hypothetical protein
MAIATEAEFDAKERRIDDLVEQAAKLVADLNATVADMKKILEAASANVEAQQEISAEGRRGRGG